MVLGHVADREGFEADMTVAVDQFPGFLVSEVLPAPGDVPVKSSEFFARFAIPVRLRSLPFVPLSSAHLLLALDDERFCLTQEPGIFDRRAVIGEGSEVGEAQVYPDRLAGHRERLGFYLADDAGIPMVTLAFDATLPGLTFQGAMPPDLDLAYPGEEQTVTDNLDAIAPLREHEGVEPGYRFEPGKALLFGSFFAAAKEVVVGFLESLDGLLQDLRMDILDR